MGAKKQTIGYHYIMTLLFGFGRGPINEMHEITVGGKTAWGGHMCTGDPGVINNPNLFGGTKKEGGIQGGFYLYMGEGDQELKPATSFNTAAGGGIGKNFAGLIKAILGGPVRVAKMRDLRTIPGQVSQLRGIVTFHFNGLISSMNPYPKEWAFRLRRTTAGWHGGTWYAQKATIWMGEGRIMAMNPAHIVYQLLTDPTWGAGEDREEINEESFIAAANTLCEEGFGLCMKWERKDDVDKYIKTVLDHMGGSLFQDRESGLYTLKLIRGDYVIDDLPLFTPDSGLIEITEDDSEATADAINEVIATGTDPLKNGDSIQVRVQNIASMQASGGRNSSPVNYPGVPTSELLLRVAERDLKASSLGLKRFTLKLDRRAWRIYPAMPFRIAHPKRGIAEIVVRLADYEDRNDMGDGFIQVKVIEDVYAMPSTSFVTPVDSEWEGPSLIAAPALEERLLETSYRDIYVARGAADAEALLPTDAMIGQLAAAPDVSNREYDLWSAVDPAELEQRTTGFFTDYGLLVDPIGPYDSVIKLSNLTPGFGPEDVVGQALLIGNEVVGVIDWEDGTDEYEIARGAADTIPQPHAAGARVWTLDDDITSDGVIHQTGETINTKVQSITSSDILDIEEAALQTITLVGRQARPYPPADLQVDGELVLTAGGGERDEPVFTWAHRDRILQADALLDTQEASVGPEVGTTYTFRVYDLDDNLLGTHDGIAGDTWTYTNAMQTADVTTPIVRIEVESERDGLPSYQKYSFNITLDGGYGYGYGMNYGGA